ncbi:hypothetical protein [Mesonia maritima]|uniref:3-oxoacyl-ACP synthase n=1 Tax=Mesonia maritima TaxID=1793873 RepID=A0ABU1K8M2_9FLAO|nr:hypothetical protein [Mesonia maritima]MDR6301671.1 hypothetical protein [Mesonia maritima]
MKENYYITDFVKITDQQLYHRDKKVVEEVNGTLKSLLKKSYKSLEISYPKFHKMDSLSKLGFIAVEFLKLEQEFPSDTALVFQNSESSLHTDYQHQQTIQNKEAYFPSPAVFVYTLPNIVMGELAIRHQLQSENTFFIQEKFNAEYLTDYVQELFNSKKASAAISGWIDLNNEGYNVFLAFVSKNGTLPFTKENLENIFYNK